MLQFHPACYAIDFDPGMDRAKWLRCCWPVAIPPTPELGQFGSMPGEEILMESGW